GAVGGGDEAVQVEVEAVLHGGGIDLRDEAARAREGAAVETRPLAEGEELSRRLARLRPAAAADDDSELLLAARETALQSPEDARRYPARVPVHPHHAPERLEPERMREPAQDAVRPFFEEQGRDDDG